MWPEAWHCSDTPPAGGRLAARKRIGGGLRTGRRPRERAKRRPEARGARSHDALGDGGRSKRDGPPSVSLAVRRGLGRAEAAQLVLEDGEFVWRPTSLHHPPGLRGRNHPVTGPHHEHPSRPTRRGDVAVLRCSGRSRTRHQCCHGAGGPATCLPVVVGPCFVGVSVTGRRRPLGSPPSDGGPKRASR